MTLTNPKYNLSNILKKNIPETNLKDDNPSILYEKAIHYKDFSEDQYIHYLELAALQGHIEAQFELGCEYDRLFYDSKTIPQSYGMAAHYFKLAADQGHGQAQIRLGYLYEYGLGVIQSYDKAAYYYQQATKYPLANALLGQCYELGHGVEQSFEQAKKYYTVSCCEDWINPESALQLAEKLFISAEQTKLHKEVFPNMHYAHIKEMGFRSFQNAFLYYKAKAIATGDIKSFEKVIDWYSEGKYIQKNLIKVGEYLRLLDNLIAQNTLKVPLKADNRKYQKIVRFLSAQKQANDLSAKIEDRLKAQLDMATYYNHGIGLELKACPQLAKFYMLEVVKSDQALALYEVGRAYDYGDNGFECSAKLAAEYYLKAAEKGYSSAQYAIGTFFERGTEVERSNNKAIEYYTKAAEQGHAFAIGMLGILNENKRKKSVEEVLGKYPLAIDDTFDEKKLLEQIAYAIKVPSQTNSRLLRCYEEAFIYYRLKAANGDPIAQCRVGDFFRLKLDPFADKTLLFAKSKYYYLLSAQQGYAKAQRWLGYIFDYEGNYKEAFKLFETAAKQGDPYGLAFLGRCYEEGLGVPQCIEEAEYYYDLSNKACWDKEDFYEDSFNVGPVALFIYNKMRAALGNVNAKRIVAGCYEKGIGVLPSVEHSAYYRASANSGSPIDMPRLIQDAERGERNAQYQLAICYSEGYQIAASKRFYKNCLLLSLSQGLKEAFLEFAKIDYGLEEFSLSYEESAKYVKAAADRGLLIAKFHLGYLYEHGLGVEKSFEEAQKNYFESVACEDDLAAWNYDYFCEKNNLPRLLEQSPYFYYKVLENSAYKLENAAQDMTDGAKYLKMAHEELNSQKAEYFLEKSFRTFKKAFLLYRAKAFFGDANAIAIQHLANCYLNGTGVEKSEGKANYYSKLALEKSKFEALLAAEQEHMMLQESLYKLTSSAL